MIRKNITLYLCPVLTLSIITSLSVAKIDSSDVINDEGISYKVILIGDTGEPAKEIEEPVLKALAGEASIIPESTLVIFLGDNIYSNGLPPEDEPERKESERRIDEQIDAVNKVGANGIFIPGNHDWAQDNEDGWGRIKLQAEYINNNGSAKIEFLPLNGCPGPVVRDFGSLIRVIVLDSQWWLQDKSQRPEPEDSICSFCREDEITNAIDSILNISRDKFVIIVAHHPLSSHGSHGGYFTWRDHIFPLTNLNDYLWIPLPIIGSLYPLVRGSGISKQDIGNDEYQNMKDGIEYVISKYSGLVYASGHEHALQILKGVNDNLYIVSGAGYWGHVEKSLGEGDDTIFAGRHEGFIILNFLTNGRIELSVIKVLNESGDNQVVFTMQLNDEY